MQYPPKGTAKKDPSFGSILGHMDAGALDGTLMEVMGSKETYLTAHTPKKQDHCLFEISIQAPSCHTQVDMSLVSHTHHGL